MKSMHIAALSGNNTCVGCERSGNRKHHEEISTYNISRSDNNNSRTGKEAGSEKQNSNITRSSENG